MSRDELTKLLVEHIDAWNDHDLDRLMSLFSDDCVFEASGGSEVQGQRFEGKASVRDAFAGVFDRIPDAHWGGGRHYLITEDYCVSEWTLTGTLSDGSRIEVNGCDFLTVRAGQITKKNAFRKQRPSFRSTS